LKPTPEKPEQAQ